MFFNCFWEAPLETAARPADTEDAGACKERKKGLGSLFKVARDNAAGTTTPPQKDLAITLEIQPYFQMETLDPEEDPLTWWRYPNDVPTSFKIGKEIFVYSCHKFLFRKSL